MTVRVFDAWSPDDPALINSHQVAQWTLDALAPDVSALEGGAVTRVAVNADLAQAYEGFVFFGHGSDRALWGVGPHEAREPVFDLDNLSAIASRWLHAFACLSGNGLAPTAPREGVGVFAGYNVQVVVEFTATDLPPALERLLVRAVTLTTLRLRGGVRSQTALVREVRGACQQMRRWLITNQRQCLQTMSRTEWIGLQTLATLLHDSLELHGTEVRE